jgi:hypothetical protein
VIYRSSDRLKLTALGWDLARNLTPEARIFRVMIGNTPAYHSALGWFLQSNLHRVTAKDVLAYWRQQQRSLFPDQSDEKTLEAAVNTFFQLCHAADLGVATRGRKGQPTRLHLHPDELAAYLEDEKPAAIKAPQPSGEHGRDTRVERRPRLVTTGRGQPEPFRVLISYNLNSNIAVHLREIIELIGIECEVIQRRAGDLSPLADDLLEALRRSAAALIIISRADCHTDSANNPVLNETGMVEIGAAFVRYEGRVQLLWDKNIPLPARLKNLPCCAIEGDELPSWETGLRLIKSIKDFEQSFQQEVLKRPLE